MCGEYLSSVLLEMELRVIEKLAKIPIGRVQRWVRKKVVAKIESGLNIASSEFILEEKVGQWSQTQITVHIWSSLPLKLNTESVLGNFRLEEFETELNWDRKGKDIYKHIITDIKPNNNVWAFVVRIPTETLRKHVSSYWHLDFVAYFQKEFCKTFKDIKLKFRQSDVNRLRENN